MQALCTVRTMPTRCNEDRGHLRDFLSANQTLAHAPMLAIRSARYNEAASLVKTLPTSIHPSVHSLPLPRVIFSNQDRPRPKQTTQYSKLYISYLYNIHSYEPERNPMNIYTVLNSIPAYEHTRMMRMAVDNDCCCSDSLLYCILSWAPAANQAQGRVHHG